MRTQVRKWGNSRGMIFPAAALEQCGLNLGTEVEIILKDGGVFLKPAAPVYDLAALLADFPDDYQLSDDEMEWESMKPRGEEL